MVINPSYAPNSELSEKETDLIGRALLNLLSTQIKEFVYLYPSIVAYVRDNPGSTLDYFKEDSNKTFNAIYDLACKFVPCPMPLTVYLAQANEVVMRNPL